MKIDVIIAEIGSTTTVVNAFDGIKKSVPVYLSQGQAPTTVALGDVNIGIKNAFNNLKENLKVDDLDYDEFFATSSAAGGLKMTVHGLVYDMTVRAAKEAALGAGANIHLITAGKIRDTDIKKIKKINPDIILLAGGIDYGERETSLHNAECIAKEIQNSPIIYAGNIENRQEIVEIFKSTNNQLYIVDNVYPKIDQLNVLPTREKIQDVFEEHIIHAPGMMEVRNMVNMNIIPTPGAVMLAAGLLESELGDLAVIDVGGATTDIHSVTDGSEEISRIILNPEPKAKRTVEGDLGVYINRENLIYKIGIENLSKKLDISTEGLTELIKNYKPIPETNEEKKLVRLLTLEAAVTAMSRHVGQIRNLYGPAGKRSIAEGKDLTKVKYLIGTGGALTKLEGSLELVKQIQSNNKGNELLPGKDIEILIDKKYIMASLGVLSKKYPECALKLLKESLGVLNELS